MEKVKPRTSSVEDKRSNNSPVLPLSSSKQKPSSLHRKSAPPKLSHKDNKRQPHIQLEDEFPDLIDSESARLERFGKLLAGPNTDINQLKKLSWSGIPPAVRPATWQLLLVSGVVGHHAPLYVCLLYTSPSPRDRQKSRMPSSA